VALALLTAAGVPVAAPSANLFSRPSPTRASHVLEDLDGRIDLIVDGGPTEVGVESTVLDLTGDVPSILRPGAVSLEMLRSVLPRVERRTGEPVRGPMPSPGMLDRHYAPRAPLTVYDDGRGDGIAHLVRDACASIAQGQRVGIMAATEDRAALAELERVSAGATIVYLGSEHDLPTIASRLYASMRELDASGVDRILVRSFPGNEGLATAIQDRLRRASVRSQS
jgi:L-threonylcarbamoyladenylate synthase